MENKEVSFNKEEYTIKELAYLVDREDQHIFRSIEKGRLIASKKGKNYLIKKKDAEDFYNHLKHNVACLKTKKGEINLKINYQGIIDDSTLFLDKIEAIIKNELKLQKHMEIKACDILITKKEEEIEKKHFKSLW